MIDRLPEGISIGWMQAPPQWIFTHTARFIGVVRVVIQDGEGFILIQKGKPLAYYFRHGRIEMHGHAALDYFNSHPTIEFNLCKYTPDEMAEALRICAIDADGQPVPPPVPERRPPEISEIRPAPQPVPSAPAPAPGTVVAEPARPEERPEPEEVISFEPEPAEPEPEVPPQPQPAPEPPARPARTVLRSMPPPPPPVFNPVSPPAAPPAMPQAAPVVDDQTLKIIGQIKKLNGVVAISVFNDDRNLILMGDVEIEPLLNIARSMLGTSRKISPYIQWGAFVHMTLQIPEGNVIVAPYRDNYLCLLTTRTINIGHIRRILRDIQVMGE